MITQRDKVVLHKKISYLPSSSHSFIVSNAFRDIVVLLEIREHVWHMWSKRLGQAKLPYEGLFGGKNSLLLPSLLTETLCRIFPNEVDSFNKHIGILLPDMLNLIYIHISATVCFQVKADVAV